MLLILVFIAFLFSAFFSFSEMIFTVTDRIKIRVWSKSGKTTAKAVKKLIKNPDNFLIPVLVGNNIANVAYATFFAYFMAGINTGVSHFESTFYLTIFLVIFAEMIPKIIGKKYSSDLSLKIVYPFMFIKAVLSPFSYFITRISRIIMKMTGVKAGGENWYFITKGEIEYIIGNAAKTDAVDKKDAEIIKKILSLGETKVKEIMRHRKSIVAVDIKSPVYRLKKIIMLTSLSKIIVYENGLDNIRGAVFVRDLLKDTKDIESIVRPVLFVPENSSVLSLFKNFKTEKATISIVIDEFGGCVGLLTMHDILELIVGRVDDPHDSLLSDRGIIYRAEKNILIVDGSADVGELGSKILSITGEKKFGSEERFETINGYLINHLKRIPVQGEVFEIDGINYKIARAKKNFIETLVIELKNGSANA
jgi:putative hemolysin